MKFSLTKNCKEIMESIKINKCKIDEDKETNKTKQIFKEFYNHFVDAENFLKTIDISPEIEKIKNNNYNKSNDHGYIIKPIRDYIDKFVKYDITYSLKLYDKIVNIFFITGENFKIEEIKRKIYRIILWLHVVIKYAKNTFCSKELNIYVFLTDLTKQLPKHKHEEIGKINVNTGFTMTCQEKSSIVIYRKEEWYKVFVHETMHNLELDFSGMDNDNTRKFILKIFHVKSDVKLYEAYTDAWAKILNVLITSYLVSDRTYKQYQKFTQEYINLERTHCFFQCIKILHHMGLTYRDLYSDNEYSSNLRKLYKEQTSILSYYILNAVILNIYQDFLIWCQKNNTSDSILQFVKNRENQYEFCKFIEENYKTKNMLDSIDCISKMFEKENSKSYKNNNLLENMRKSLMEIE
jgi:hypothetical protein